MEIKLAKLWAGLKVWGKAYSSLSPFWCSRQEAGGFIDTAGVNKIRWTWIVLLDD